MILKNLKKEFVDHWELSTKKLAYAYECFFKIEDYQKLVNNLKEKHLFSNLKSVFPDDSEIERTNQFINLFDFDNGEKLTRL